MNMIQFIAKYGEIIMNPKVEFKFGDISIYGAAGFTVVEIRENDYIKMTAYQITDATPPADSLPVPKHLCSYVDNGETDLFCVYNNGLIHYNIRPAYGIATGGVFQCVDKSIQPLPN